MASAAGHVDSVAVSGNTTADFEDFFVYVTGIACCGNMTLVDVWVNEFIEGFVDSTSAAGYKTLHVVFYDPVEECINKELAWKRCIKLLDSSSVIRSGRCSYIRYYEFDYFEVNGDLSKGPPPENEVVVDLAHIFNYSRSGKPLYRGREYEGIKVVYPGYVGADTNHTGESIPSRYKYIMLSDIFYDHTTRKSYIDVIVDVFGQLDVLSEAHGAVYPWDTVENFLSGNLTVKINERLTEKRHRLTGYEDFMKSENAMKAVIACLKTAASYDNVGTEDRKAVFLTLVKDHLFSFINSGI